MKFAHGMVIGKFYPPHLGHHHLIRAAARRCEQVTVIACASTVESIPLADRVAWLRAEHDDTPWVRVVGTMDEHATDYDDPDVWEIHCAIFREALGGDVVDAVFTSEPYGPELARRFGATSVAVDVDRAAVPVSGTAVRADPAGQWEFLAPSVRAWFAKRVVVLGAESSGTTKVSRALAEHYGAEWVPEYGREYTELKLARAHAADPAATVFDLRWEAEDFAMVAKHQNAAEDAAAGRGGPLLFCDTDSFATRVWEERYLGSTSLVSTRKPALYLLTDHDGVPFEDDGLRDGEDIRPWMTARFVELLATTGVPWLRLTGDLDERLRTAVQACDALLAKGWSLAAPLG
ncbi:AAA family ATPase [Amycolatopsis sp. cg5]|uniref:AAA family ATPase n=1 Tax=Amycolatopsis sp. cg5 TaxID=3238802 RepID=UPI0035247F3C